jgi:hypothetical protein
LDHRELKRQDHCLGAGHRDPVGYAGTYVNRELVESATLANIGTFCLVALKSRNDCESALRLKPGVRCNWQRNFIPQFCRR